MYDTFLHFQFCNLHIFIFFRNYVHDESVTIQKQITKEVLNKIISLKVDAVTRLNRSFLGINIQYIMNEIIVLRTIGLVELTESHTGT